MNRDIKAQEIQQLQGEIGNATNAFLIDFKGITVPQVTELRRQVRETNSKYVVVKNTLALIATKDSPMQGMEKSFSGHTAVAYNSTDAVALAKALTKFAKDVPALQFKGAMLNGQIVPANQIQTIASLPTKNELISKLLFVMQAPIRNLAIVLNANIRNIAVVIDQIAKQRGGDATPADDSTPPAEESAPAAADDSAPPAEAAAEEAAPPAE